MKIRDFCLVAGSVETICDVAGEASKQTYTALKISAIVTTQQCPNMENTFSTCDFLFVILLLAHYILW